jgi:predicted  nucleic acid-binding Zn-ribbon protein
MTETLPRLLALQVCDQRIQQITRTLDALRQALVALDQAEEARTQDLRARQDSLKEAKSTRDDLTLQLNQVKGQLREKRHALHHHRVGQQDETLHREVELLEAHKGVLEEELRAVVTQISQNTEILCQAEEEAAAQKQHALSKSSQILTQIAAEEKELLAMRQERLTLVRSIDTALLREYERIFSHRGGVAVVEIVQGACQGCHMRLPPQMCVELQKNRRLTFCPHCHRILFVMRESLLPPRVSRHSSANSNGHRSRHVSRQAQTRTHTDEKPAEAGQLPPRATQMKDHHSEGRMQ